MPDHGIRGKKATEVEEFNYTQPTNYYILGKLCPIKCSLSNNWVVTVPDCQESPMISLGGTVNRNIEP